MEKGIIRVICIIGLTVAIHYVVKRKCKSNKIISIATLLPIVFAAIDLAVTLSTNTNDPVNTVGTVQMTDSEEMSSNGIDLEKMFFDTTISDQDFAEKFCEKVQEILLSSNDNKRDDVKTMLNELKTKSDGNENLEERYEYTLSNCGITCLQLGYIYDAAVFTEESLAFAQGLEVSSENYKFIGLCYTNRAHVLIQQDQNLEAEECYLTALHLFEQQNDLYNSDMVVIYTDLANYYLDDAEYALALNYQEKAIKILEYFNQTNTVDMGIAHIMMARICRYMDKNRQARELDLAQQILENNKPESNIYLMTLYGDLGKYHWNTDKLKAEDYFNKARELALDLQGELGEDTINSEINLAFVYSEYGQNQKAFDILKSVETKCMAIYGETGIGSAYVYAELAAVYADLQKYTQSIQYYDKALAIYEDVYGPKHPDLAYVYGNKANTLMRMGQESEAIASVEKAIKILEANNNNTQIDMALLLRKKAEFIVETEGNLGEAVQLLQEAREIFIGLYGEVSDYVVDTDLQIGQIYVGMGNSDSYKKLSYVIDRYKELYGDNSYKLYQAYISLGECLYWGLGEESEMVQTKKSIDYFSKAYAILELYNCSNTDDGIYCYKKLGLASYEMGDLENAIIYFERAQDICFILQKENSLENRWLWARMARVYAYNNDIETAKEYLEYTENFMDTIVDEDEQLKIYTDILETCVVLKEDEKRVKYAQYLNTIVTEDNTSNDFREWVHKNMN